MEKTTRSNANSSPSMFVMFLKDTCPLRGRVLNGFEILSRVARPNKEKKTVAMLSSPWPFSKADRMPIASMIPDTEAKRSMSVKLQGLKSQRNCGKCGIFRQINWLNDLLLHRTLIRQTTKRSRYLLQWKFRSQVLRDGRSFCCRPSCRFPQRSFSPVETSI